MWIKRDFERFLSSYSIQSVHPVKILKGPRQVGKTSLLEHVGHYQLVQLDDFQTRERALENPRLFLDQYWSKPIILDEATLAPSLFSEMKRRVDDYRRLQRKGEISSPPDIWVTGSNQTLLEQSVQESLAGRASYFDLNTLSLHELGPRTLAEYFLKGGWPELYTNPKLSPVRYLNDLVATFIEKDIVAAAGIERKAAFTKTTGLLAGRIGQLMNASDIAKNVGVETTTVQSWIAKLEQNAIVRILPPYFNNLNQRLIKTPKIYFDDVGLATRFQGWTEFEPLYTSSSFGHLVENLGVIEFARFFSNRGLRPELFFLRSKEKVEVDLLVKLPNHLWLAVEIKVAPTDLSHQQLDLLKKTGLEIVQTWVISPGDVTQTQMKHCRALSFHSIHSELEKLFSLATGSDQNDL